MREHTASPYFHQDDSASWNLQPTASIEIITGPVDVSDILADERSATTSNIIDPSRPCCIRCHFPLAKRTAKRTRTEDITYFVCTRCKTSNVRETSGQRYTRQSENTYPRCLRCASHLIRHRQRGESLTLQCKKCRVYRTLKVQPEPLARIELPHTGEELMKLAARVLPASLPPDIREEAEQAIILALLTGEIAAADLGEPRTVKRFVTQAYGPFNKFKFISLDAPLNDEEGSSTFGDLLAA